MTGSQTDKVCVPLRDVELSSLCYISGYIFRSGAWEGNEEAFQRWMSIRELIDIRSRGEDIPPRKLEVFLRAVEYGHLLRHQMDGTQVHTNPSRTCCELAIVIDTTIRLLNRADRVRP